MIANGVDADAKVGCGVACALFGVAFAVVGLRLVDVTLLKETREPHVVQALSVPPIRLRADIVDRNGELLATSLPTSSLYANPRQIANPKETAAALGLAPRTVFRSWNAACSAGQVASRTRIARGPSGSRGSGPGRRRARSAPGRSPAVRSRLRSTTPSSSRCR